MRSAVEHDPEVARVQRIARVLDDAYVDPILGLLLPGAGDLVGSVLGLYTVTLAIRKKVAPIIIARMLMNLAVDAGVGVIPFAGDLFDLGFKANKRNIALLADRTNHGGRGTTRDWLAVVGAGAVFLIAIVGVIALAVWAIAALLRSIA